MDGSEPSPQTSESSSDVTRARALPGLSPTLLFVTVIGMILAFESFGQIHILTRGGPLDATTVIVYSIYLEAFQRFDYGVAAVQAVGLFVLVLGLTGLQLRFLERRVFYQ